MLFRSISLPSISGHFRFDSVQCNSSATHISSLQGFAPAFLRYSSPLLILSTLSFSVAPHIQTPLFLCVPKRLRTFPWHIFSVLFLSSSLLRFPFPGNAVPAQFISVLCLCNRTHCCSFAAFHNSPTLPGDSMPLPSYAIQFSSVAIPCLSMPLPIVTLLYNPRLFLTFPQLF